MGIDVLPNFVGFAIMIYALRKLVNHGENFRRARFVLYFLTIWGVGITGMEIASALYNSYCSCCYDESCYDIGFAATHLGGMRVAHFAGMAAMHYFLLMGMHRLAVDVGVAKIARKSKRNMYFSVGFLGAQVVLMTTFAIQQFGAPLWFTSLNLILWTAMLLMNSVQIFSCYMWICYEGDEDMEKKPKNVERSYEREKK